MQPQAGVAANRRADVHLFEAGGFYLAFDVNSGSLHRLDEPAWFLLQSYLEGGDWRQACAEAALRFDPPEVEETAAELQELISEGVLFAAGEEWENYTPGEGLGLKALCLNIAHDCNLACKYCFVPGEVRRRERTMPPEVIAEALDFLLRETPYEYLTVDFFGGEPLLNFEGIKYAVDYALKMGKEKKWKFTVSTNTLLLGEEELEFFREHGFSLVLSCDGRPEVHDSYRVTPGGGNTSRAVRMSLERFLAGVGGAEYYVRGTYTRHNLDFTRDVLYLAGLGAESISLEPVVASPEADYALREEDLPALREEYFRLARALVELEEQGRRVNFYHFCLDLQGGPCVAKRLTGCGAGYQYLAVNPLGEIYPCHQFDGRPEYLLGDVRRGIVATDLQERFRGAHIYRKERCVNCWARFLCGGGCHAQASYHSDDLLKPDPLACRVMQARLEGALYYMALHEELLGAR